MNQYRNLHSNLNQDLVLMTKVFISYSRSDTEFADEIVAGLKFYGEFDVLIDRSGIHEGEDWQERLSSLIASADTVVFILSRASANSEICKWEVNEAERLSKRLIPVQKESLEGEKAPCQLTKLNYVRFDPEDNGRNRSFIDGLERLCGALNTNIEWLREHTRLLTRAMEWDRAGRKDNRLLVGSDVDAAQEWLHNQTQSAPQPTELHRDFISQSAQTEAKHRSEEHERAERLQRAVDISKRLSVWLIMIASIAFIFAIGASVAGWLAYEKKKEADEKKSLAIHSLVTGFVRVIRDSERTRVIEEKYNALWELATIPLELEEVRAKTIKEWNTSSEKFIKVSDGRPFGIRAATGIAPTRLALFDEEIKNKLLISFNQSLSTYNPDSGRALSTLINELQNNDFSSSIFQLANCKKTSVEIDRVILRTIESRLIHVESLPNEELVEINKCVLDMVLNYDHLNSISINLVKTLKKTTDQIRKRPDLSQQLSIASKDVLKQLVSSDDVEIFHFFSTLAPLFIQHFPNDAAQQIVRKFDSLVSKSQTTKHSHRISLSYQAKSINTLQVFLWDTPTAKKVALEFSTEIRKFPYNEVDFAAEDLALIAPLVPPKELQSLFKYLIESTKIYSYKAESFYRALDDLGEFLSVEQLQVITERRIKEMMIRNASEDLIRNKYERISLGTGMHILSKKLDESNSKWFYSKIHRAMLASTDILNRIIMVEILLKGNHVEPIFLQDVAKKLIDMLENKQALDDEDLQAISEAITAIPINLQSNAKVLIVDRLLKRFGEGDINEYLLASLRTLEGQFPELSNENALNDAIVKLIKKEETQHTLNLISQTLTVLAPGIAKDKAEHSALLLIKETQHRNIEKQGFLGEALIALGDNQQRLSKISAYGLLLYLMERGNGNSKAFKKLAEKLTAQQLAEILKWPLSIDGASAVLLAELEKKLSLKSSGTVHFNSNLVAFATQAQKLGITNIIGPACRPTIFEALREISASNSKNVTTSFWQEPTLTGDQEQSCQYLYEGQFSEEHAANTRQH